MSGTGRKAWPRERTRLQSGCGRGSSRPAGQSGAGLGWRGGALAGGAQAKRSPGNPGGAAFERKRGANQDVRGKPFRRRGESGELTSLSSAPRGPPGRWGPGDSLVPRFVSGTRSRSEEAPAGPHAGLGAHRAALDAAIPSPGRSCQPLPRPARAEPGLAELGLQVRGRVVWVGGGPVAERLLYTSSRRRTCGRRWYPISRRRTLRRPEASVPSLVENPIHIFQLHLEISSLGRPRFAWRGPDAQLVVRSSACKAAMPWSPGWITHLLLRSCIAPWVPPLGICLPFSRTPEVGFRARLGSFCPQGTESQCHLKGLFWGIRLDRRVLVRC